MKMSTKSKRQPSETIYSAVAQSRKIDIISIGNDILVRVPDLLRTYLKTDRVFIVADENTMEVAGNLLKEILTKQGVLHTGHIFPGKPRLKGTVENAQVLIPRLQAYGGVPVAVGSGVINDLTRYAAFQVGQPFISIATAASMDGYASAGSPLTQNGFKHTIACHPPRVIVADLGIISGAPKEMSGWGYGDLAGKLPAGADWLIADALKIEKIDPKAWVLVQDDLHAWLSDPTGLKKGDHTPIGALFTGLVSTGIAMEIHGSSRPASGADHQVAHLWEMDGVEYGGSPLSHGICVALGTLSILSLYEWILAQDFSHLDIDKTIRQRRRLPQLEREIRQHFPLRRIAERTLAETQAKYIQDDQLRNRLEQIKTIWPVLRKQLAGFLIPFDQMKKMFIRAGVATDPIDVGIDRAYHRQTLIRSRLIRRRYTVLDFLEDTGRFNEAIEHIFSKSGRWG